MQAQSATRRHHHLGRNREIAWQSTFNRFGWRPKYQFRYVNRLWDRESSWNVYASNPYSGAYGIPQAVPGSKIGIGWAPLAVQRTDPDQVGAALHQVPLWHAAPRVGARARHRLVLGGTGSIPSPLAGRRGLPASGVDGRPGIEKAPGRSGSCCGRLPAPYFPDSRPRHQGSRPRPGSRSPARDQLGCRWTQGATPSEGTRFAVLDSRRRRSLHHRRRADPARFTVAHRAVRDPAALSGASADRHAGEAAAQPGWPAARPGDRRRQRTRRFTGLSVLRFSDGAERPLALPEGAQVSVPVWAPDGQRFAFTVDEPDGIGVWTGDVGADADPVQVPGLRVRDVLGAEPPGLGGTVRWSRDGGSLYVLGAPPDYGRDEPGRGAPIEPRISEVAASGRRWRRSRTC